MPKIPALDLYRELEVDPAASAETIEAAWKSLLKRHHPDVATDKAAAHERVKRLNLAHEWLSDPTRRAAYDASRPPIRPRPNVTSRVPTVVPRRPATPGPATAAAAADAGGARATSHAHNPYADYPTHDRLRRFGTPAPHASRAGDAVPSNGVAGDGRRPARMPALLIPVLLASIVVLVAASVIVRPPGTAPVVELRSGGSLAAGTQASQVDATAGASGALFASGDPRMLPSPDLRADLPSDCQSPAGRPFEFETTVDGQTAKVVVVGCGGARSAGPILYVATPGAWELAGKLGPHTGGATQGFSGPLSEAAGDGFGVIWRRPDGIQTLSLYRMRDGLREYWDSSSIGLAWNGATFQYEPSGDPESAGRLVVEWPDLTTGTPDCPTCPDHDMYRDSYRWDASRPVPVLTLEEHLPDGLGPR